MRRAIPQPGAPRTLTDVHGYRYPLCLTNLADPDIAVGETLHRRRGEPVLRTLKDTGWAPLSSANVASNQVRLTAVLIADTRVVAFRELGLSGTPRHTPRCSMGPSA